MEFHYYSKSYTNKKEENKDNNKGIKLIKEFVETMYSLFITNIKYKPLCGFN